jgi:predicted transcriptional regulator
MSGKSNLAVKIERELRDRLRALGEAKRRTPHWLMCEAIRLYVEREEEAERGKAEARARLARYDATGEYVAGGDVTSWLKTWGSGRERPAPARRRRAPPR